MDHLEATKHIYTFLDDELSQKKRLALKKHIDSCSDCQQRIANEYKLRSVLKESLLKQKTPFYVKGKIKNEMEKIDKESVIREKYRIPSQLRPIFVSMLGGLIFLGVISGIFFYKWQEATRESTIFPRLAAKHIVFASQENLVDISSSDMEELVTWFEGKVDFPFSVPFYSEELDLLGGRLSVLHQKGAVHLFYQWGDCQFSFFTFECATKNFPGAHRKEYNGKEYYIAKYNDQFIIFWMSSGLGYALVCDDEEELLEIASQIL